MTRANTEQIKHTPWFAKAGAACSIFRPPVHSTRETPDSAGRDFRGQVIGIVYLWPASQGGH